MLKIILVSSIVFSANAFAQTTIKPDPDSQINAEEQIHGLPGGTKTGAYSVRTKKRVIKLPPVIAPVQNNTPANCADSFGGSGGGSFTACEAAKKTR